MKKYFSLILLIILLFSCSERNIQIIPNSPSISGSFSVVEVKEGELIVYKKGNNNNIYPGYERFKIIFKSEEGNQRIEFTEITGETFKGKWKYESSNKKLTFYELNPLPLIDAYIFYVKENISNKLVLKSGQANPKTGETINTYILEKI